jgi:MFS family permease
MAGVAEFATRARALHALRSRDFRLLWLGQTVSLIGDSAFLIALAWKTVSFTHSKGSLGFVLMANAAAMLTTLLIGGALADRYSRRRLMIASDLVRAAVVAGLATVDATGHLSLTWLIVFAAAVGLGDGFFQPAFGGMVPQVVEEGHIASANSLIALARHGSLLVGPTIAAGIYYSAGSATVFGIDACSFVFSAGLVYLARPRRVEPEASEGFFTGIGDGVRYVAGIPWLWMTIGIASIILMIGVAPFQVLLPTLVKQHFHRGVGSYGLLFTLTGVGMVIGTVTFGQLNARRSILVTYGFWAATDFFRLTVAIAPWYYLAAGFSFLRGACIGFSLSMWETMVMERVPESRLSRVISLDWFGSTALLPVGYALAAVVAGLASPAVIISIGAIGSMGLWVVALASGRLRGLR